MKKLVVLAFGLSLALGTTIAFAQNTPTDTTKKKKKKKKAADGTTTPAPK